MRYQELLSESREHLRRFPAASEQTVSFFIFTNGAEWMLDRMNELDGKKRIFDASTPYAQYGYFKYGICLMAFFALSYFLFYEAMILLPAAILVFYILEIHFLFLFPLLLDKVENPLLRSIKMTYDIGCLQALLTVMPIGFFMVFGLLNLKKPLKNWYLGCLSILIWYNHERD